MTEKVRDWIIRRADNLMKECGHSPSDAFAWAAAGAARLEDINWDGWDRTSRAEKEKETGEGEGVTLETKRQAEVAYGFVRDIAEHAGVSEEFASLWLLEHTRPYRGR